MLPVELREVKSGRYSSPEKGSQWSGVDEIPFDVDFNPIILKRENLELVHST